MPTFKMTMLMELQTNPSGTSVGARIGGWSESWYWDNALTVGKSAFQNLCQKRAALLPTSARVTGQRYQQVGPSVGASQIDSRIYPGLSATATDVPQMAILVKVGATGGLNNIRNWVMRGLPDARVVEGEYAPSVAFTTAFTAYANALSGFLFRGKNLAADQAEINFIDANGVATLNGPLATSAGTMVQIKRTIDANEHSFSGRFKVGTGPTSSVVPLINWQAGLTQGGIMQLYQIIYPNVDISNVTLGRVIVKKVGRPFTGYRGRRSNRR